MYPKGHQSVLIKLIRVNPAARVGLIRYHGTIPERSIQHSSSFSIVIIFFIFELMTCQAPGYSPSQRATAVNHQRRHRPVDTGCRLGRLGLVRASRDE